MTPLLALQQAYGAAIYEAERNQRLAVRLRQQIDAIAQADADSQAKTAVYPVAPQDVSVRIPQALFYRGLSSRVARKLGVSVSLVCRMIKGQKPSARVTNAVFEEISRVEAELAAQKGGAA